MSTPNPSLVGEMVTVTATVSAVSPGSGTPTGTVDVDDGMGEMCTIALIGGTGTCMITPVTSGARIVTGNYSGDANYNASVGTTDRLVQPPNAPPDCSGATLSRTLCWPPNHKLALIEIEGISDPDDDPVEITITSITQDEPLRDRARGSGATCPDAILVDADKDGNPDSAKIRCERDAVGNGRVYTIHYTARDETGEECSGSLTLCAPLEPNMDCVDDGQNFDSTVSVCRPRRRNERPVLAGYKVTVVEGEVVEIPVVATDRETPTADLLVAPVGPLPPGVSWNAARRVLTWDSPGAIGTYKVTMLADDGESQPGKAKYVIKAIRRDNRPGKNKPPIPAKIRPIQAVVGEVLTLTILASDPDGDDITIIVNESAYPFTAGAVFSTGTNVFSWTPTPEDVGKTTVEFIVSDGLKPKKLKIKVAVLAPKS